ncbi:MAG: DNRLRE domain-containing protein [Anaerolineae bacterium]
MAADTDWGHGPKLELKNGSSGGPIAIFYPGRVAVRFDLSGIPAGATIDQAVLHLRLTDATGTEPVNVRAARANSPWSEDDSVKPGCESAGSVVRAVGAGAGWYDWDVTALVRYQFANPSTNYGFCVSEGTVDDSRTFARREGSSASRPYLRVTYRP